MASQAGRRGELSPQKFSAVPGKGPGPSAIAAPIRGRYPDEGKENEHPMTAVGIVLLAAGKFGITDPFKLAKCTGYPPTWI